MILDLLHYLPCDPSRCRRDEVAVLSTPGSPFSYRKIHYTAVWYSFVECPKGRLHNGMAKAVLGLILGV